MTFYHDTRRDLLIYERPSPLVLAHVPGAQQVNGQFVAVPRTLQASQALRWLNYPVAPIITDYDWPIAPGREAKPHQKAMANFQVLHPKCFNLSDPGTMKTLAALWAADWLMQQYPKGQCRALIVGPLNVIETVWADALWTNFLGRRTFEILYGDEQKRIREFNKKSDFAVINIDGVGVGARTYARERKGKSVEIDGFSKLLLEDETIKIVIVDEADGYVDASTKRHRIAQQIFRKRPYLWMNTGTPTAQRPDEAYGLAKLVNNAFGKSYTTFRDDTMVQVRPHIWRPRPDGYEKVRAILTPAIRFSLEEVWPDAPPLNTPLPCDIPLTEQQTKAVAELKRQLQIVLRSGKKITAANEAVARMKLLQIILGAVYDEQHKVHAIDAEPRYQHIESLIAASPRKVLIFCPLTSVVNLLYRRLQAWWKCGVINGHVAPRERLPVIKAFQEEEDFKVMIVDAQSVSHGVNQFVVCSDVIWMAPIDKTRLYIQGNRRVHRPGQKYPVTVHRIVSTPLEKEMWRRLEHNTSMQGALLDWVRRGQL